MKQEIPINPLRILLSGKDPSVTEIWRALSAGRPSIEVILAGGALGEFLQTPGYFQILLIDVPEWHALPEIMQKRCAMNTDVIILGPAPAEIADLAHARAGLFLPFALAEPEARTLLVEACFHLAKGHQLSECAVASGGRLAWQGNDKCWGRPAGTELSIDGQGSSAGVGRATAEPSRPNTSLSGINIGSVEVKGDLVVGNKTTYEAQGDQVIINRSSASKIVQQAGRDQVNINRIEAGFDPEIAQHASEDQINLNRIGGLAGGGDNVRTGDPTAFSRMDVDSEPRRCAQCGTYNPPDAIVCDQCGKPLQF